MATAEGIDNITPGVAIPIVEVLQDSAGDPVTSGTTSLAIYEIQDDGSLESFDFDDNTFKTTSLTTETASLTHRTGNGGATNTGVWTYVLSTTQLAGFTEGRKYLIRVTNSGASPPSLVRLFGYGEAPQATTVAMATSVTNAIRDGLSTFDSTRDPVTAGTVNDKSGYSLSSAAILAIWQAAVASITTAGSIGKRIVDYLTGDIFARLGAPDGDSIAADIAAVPANVEAAILNEGDATALLAAIAAKVEEFLINDGDAAATLASIATAVNAAVVAGQIGTDLAAAKASAATAATQATSAATAAAAVKLVSDKLDTALEDDGASGYQLTALALDNITLNAALCNKIADHVLRRTHTNIEASSDGDSLSLESMYGTGRTMLRANTTATAGTLTVLKTDGSTLGTRTLDTDTGLEDVQGIGP